MRPKLDWRAVLSAGALCFAYLCAAAMPEAAHAQDTQGTTPTATASKVGVSDRRLNVRAGARAVVRGRISARRLDGGAAGPPQRALGHARS